MPITALNASQMTGLSATPEVESAAAKEQNYHDDDEKRVGVHESWMLAEHEHRIDSIDPPIGGTMNTQMPEPSIPKPLIPEAPPTPKQRPNPKPKPDTGIPPPDETPGTGPKE
jgi:hypothetical protein